MNRQSQPILTPGQFLTILRGHPRRWLVPAAAVALLAGVYALVRPATWEASQALIVRNEAANSQESLGKFSQSDEMKTVQETILELVKSRKVLADALREVPPPANRKPAGEAWPTDRDVAELRKAVKLSPPKGAEFGTTEILYVEVRATSRPRAIALVAAICDQLEPRFQQLRDARAQSMIRELEKAAALARHDLAESTTRLSGIEQEVGSDLGELRGLEGGNSGDSALRRTVAEIRNELRGAEAAQRLSEELLVFLKAAQLDTDRLVATPNRLLESQPALKRLKDGLVDAQLRSAELLGRMTDRHPLVQAARESEQQIARHLHGELATATSGIQLESRLYADRVAMIEAQLETATGQLDRLAAERADYANLTAETQNRSQLLERAEQKLAEARVSQATAKAASLIGRVDGPEAGINPVGPARSMIVLAGLAGGLLVGLGTLLMTVELAPPAPTHSSPARPTDHAAHGARRCPPTSHGNGHQKNGHTETAAEPPGALSLKQALARLAATGANGN